MSELNKALAAIREYIFDENGDNDSIDATMEKLKSIEKENEISPEIDLHQYCNLFCQLKLDVMTKHFKNNPDDTDKDVSQIMQERGGKDWVAAERSILWFYINHAQEVEGLPYSKAEKAIATILNKAPGGVRFKYYEIKNAVEEGEDLATVLNKTRKNTRKASPAKTKVSTGKVGRPRKNAKPAQISQPTETPESVNTPTSANVGKPEVKESAFAESTVPAKENKTVVRNSEEPISEKTEYATGTVEPVAPAKNQEGISSEGKSIVRMMANITNNFTSVDEATSHIDGKGELTNLLSSIEKLSSIAASQAHNAEIGNRLTKRIEELDSENKYKEEELATMKEDYMALKRMLDSTIQDYEKTITQMSNKIKDSFTLFKNAHKHYFSQDEDNQFLQLPEYKKRMDVQIEKMEEAVTKLQSIPFEAQHKRSQYTIDFKSGGGVLQTN